MTDTNASTNRRGALAMMGAAASGILATSACARPQVAPVPSPSGQALPQPWTHSGDVPVVGGQIHWVALGDGPPLVMLHKLGGWVADWRHIAPLIPGRRLIALDLPGHGNSRMHGPAPHVVTVDEIVAAVIATLDHLGVERFDLLGNSIGGVAAILLAARYPERVNKLALISTMMSEPVTRAALSAREAAGSQSVATIIRTPQEQASRFGTLDPRISEEQAASNRIAGNWKSATERGAAILGSAAHLSSISAAAMVITADRGPYLKYNDVAREKLRNVRVVEVANTGPFVHQELPATVANLLNPFLQR